MRFVLALFLALLLTGCGTDLEKSVYGNTLENGVAEPVDPSMAEETEVPAGVVEMHTESAEYPVDTKEITLFYTYTGEPGTMVGYGPYYWDLEVYADGEWQQLPLNGLQTTPDLGGSIGNIPEDEYTPLTSSWTYDLSKYDYDFHPGQYRILKEFGGTVYAAEFVMVDSAPEG